MKNQKRYIIYGYSTQSTWLSEIEKVEKTEEGITVHLKDYTYANGVIMRPKDFKGEIVPFKPPAKAVITSDRKLHFNKSAIHNVHRVLLPKKELKIVLPYLI